MAYLIHFKYDTIRVPSLQGVRPEILNNLDIEVTDFHGYGTGGDNRGAVSTEARERFANPRYHEGEQVDPATVENDSHHVREEELSSHF